MIDEIVVTPVLNQEQLESLKFQLLTPSHGKLIERSTRVMCDGKIKAMYLSSKDYPLIRRWSYKMALDGLQHLKFNPAKDSDRPMIYQTEIGEELLAGWLRPRNPRREDWLRKADRDQFFEVLKLSPLMEDMERALQKYMPEYYRRVHGPVVVNLTRPQEERLKTLHKVSDPHQRAWLRAVDGERKYLFLGTHGFSTITLNHNILFGAHNDGRNVPGTLGCLTALGEYAGGELCFPRLGITFDLRPGDLLIADTNREFHGTVGGIVGSRYSVVAYLHESLLNL